MLASFFMKSWQAVATAQARQGCGGCRVAVGQLRRGRAFLVTVSEHHSDPSYFRMA